MYTIEKILEYRKDVQNAKIALENGELMQSIAFCRNSEYFDDDDVEYFKTAIIKDLDDKTKQSDIAITFLNDCIIFFNEELAEHGLISV